MILQSWVKSGVVLLLWGVFSQNGFAADRHLINVSYDVTREFYAEFNPSFARYWQQRTGEVVHFEQSNQGSRKQVRAVQEGVKADVVTLALSPDIDKLVQSRHIQPGWQTEFPSRSVPYTSTIVFLVRKGNPKNIRDWSDLTRPGVQIITPNPKVGGLPRWIYLAAWGYALKQPHSTQQKAQNWVAQLYRNVKVMDSAARASLITFTQHGFGDVLLTWESEALMVVKGQKNQNFMLVYPSISIVTEPSVAIVDKTVAKNGQIWLAKGYLNYLYSPAGQEIAAKHFYRPRHPKIWQKYQAQFPAIRTFTVDEMFGGWDQAEHVHFSPKGSFEKIYRMHE